MHGMATYGVPPMNPLFPQRCGSRQAELAFAEYFKMIELLLVGGAVAAVHGREYPEDQPGRSSVG